VPWQLLNAEIANVAEIGCVFAVQEGRVACPVPSSLAIAAALASGQLPFGWAYPCFCHSLGQSLQEIG
jgi:hypothetical protein